MQRDLELICKILLIVEQEVRELNINDYTNVIYKRLKESNKNFYWNKKAIKSHIKYLVRPFSEYNDLFLSNSYYGLEGSKFLLARCVYLPDKILSLGYLIRGLTNEGRDFISVMKYNKKYDIVIEQVNKINRYMSMNKIIDIVNNYDKNIEVEVK